ncbi:MAG: FimV/HubP family polar landmark protein [Chromatiales bacterium]|jgi:pilus assembly protein FimV
MIRKLSLAVAVATALSPLGLYALGLGEIHTYSALNQEFKADIDLLSTTSEELQDVRVELASQEAFSKAGIDRPFMLTGLKFTPSTTANGRRVIAVTSQDPIREPFLNFLIEVNWPKGRLVREYTVLLDPPVTLERTPVPVQAPRLVTTQVRDQVQVTRAEATPRANSIPPAVIPSDGERHYGPVQENDNLWNIAQSLKQGDETVEQVMLALLRYNPEAFIDNNVNLLKAGKILRLPEDADVTSMSRREARREFLAQTRVWRQQMAQDSTLVGDMGEQDSPGLLSQSAQEPADRLELVASKTAGGEQNLDQEGQAENTEQLTQLKKQLMIAEEENASVRLENQDLKNRVVALEAQLEDMQRLLTLQNDQMAELQTTQRLVEQQTESETLSEPQPVQALELAEGAVDTIDTEAIATTLSGDEEVIQQVNIEQVIADSLQAEQSPAPSTIAPETEPSAVETVSEMEISETTRPLESLAETAEAPLATTPQPVAKTRQQPNDMPAGSEAPENADLLDSLLANPTLLGLAGGVAVLLLILLGLIMRRRKEAEAEFAESILVTPEGETTLSSGRDSVGAISETSEETSFMSEFSPSDIDALQDETGEVDPISEADVYIAYGRYQQAEELIKQAIERFPEREELKHKLLEIYYSAKNESKFSSLAEELKQAGMEQNKPDLWAKIVAMGRELNPSSALFVGTAGLTASLGETEEEVDDLGLNLDSNMSDDLPRDFDTTLEAATANSKAEVDSLDFSGLEDQKQTDSEELDLGGLAFDSEFLNSFKAADGEDSSQKQPQDTLDVDLSDFGNSTEKSQDTANEDLDLASSLDGLSELSEFELEDGSQDALETEGDNIVGLENSESLEDLDLESLEKELEMLSGDLQDNEVAREEERPSVAKLGGSDLDGETEPSSILDDSLTLNVSDEVTTKLDLARAYVDMGDAEGAKSILEEVVTEGSNDQVKQARDLLEVLSA